MYIGQGRLSPTQSRHLGTSHSSPNCHQLLHHIFLNHINCLKFLPFQWWAVWGKARSHRAPNLGCRGTESPGRFDVSPKNFALDVMHDWAHCQDEAANHQLPIAVTFWIIQLVSTEEYSTLIQNQMQIHCSIHSGILNATATQDTCSLNSVYCPHWLGQWSRHCSHMCIPVHSPCLSGYIDVTETIIIILTMAELFLDRPRMSVLFISVLQAPRSGKFGLCIWARSFKETSKKRWRTMSWSWIS